ncbi:LPXTG cell wall anchor domain-containing protein [Streptacidiphilus sp. PB12-B1b]|uniref:LPXTG cell wall anchor domain-containing protein n=1 Tax=Streptacidiphilus sp. PB12-B1b TaxID=2705012 RepID=UPI0015FC82C4|nr:LPXTG cell wall anchor domain-containing protein [Streptacidiphilus sp. PB12-B1b]QMU79482.1 LPXTG cell wall anchor domain-containing protein [Streptacidiphilus sp. PB12-B1b]
MAAQARTNQHVGSLIAGVLTLVISVAMLLAPAAAHADTPSAPAAPVAAAAAPSAEASSLAETGDSNNAGLLTGLAMVTLSLGTAVTVAFRRSSRQR